MIFLVSEVLVKEDFKANRTRSVSEIILVSINPSKQSWLRFYHLTLVRHNSVCVISGFCHEAEENCAVPGCYTVSSGNSLLTFWDSLSFSLTLENGTNRLSRNVGKELSLLSA